MNKLKTSTLLKKISDNFQIVKNDYNDIWKFSNEIAHSLSHDMASVLKYPCYVSGLRFIFDDSNQRQCAYTCMADIKILEDESFLINAECLIDHARIMLQVKRRPHNSEFDYLADKIEAKYNSEFLQK